MEERGSAGKAPHAVEVSSTTTPATSLGWYALARAPSADSRARSGTRLSKAMPEIRKSSLTQARRDLLILMQRINFGRLEGLRIAAGQPVLQPLPRVITEVKLGGEKGPRAEAPWSDF